MLKRNPNRFSGERRTSEEIAQLMRDINAIEDAVPNVYTYSTGVLTPNVRQLSDFESYTMKRPFAAVMYDDFLYVLVLERADESPFEYTIYIQKYTTALVFVSQ